MCYKPKLPVGKVSDELSKLIKQHIADFTKFRWRQLPQHFSGQRLEESEKDMQWSDLEGNLYQKPNGKRSETARDSDNP